MKKRKEKAFIILGVSFPVAIAALFGGLLLGGSGDFFTAITVVYGSFSLGITAFIGGVTATDHSNNRHYRPDMGVK